MTPRVPWFLFPSKAWRRLVFALLHCSISRAQSQRIKGKDIPVAVDVEQEVGGTDRQCDPVPLPVSHPVRKRLCPGLPVVYVVIANLIPQTTALQFKIAVYKEQKCVSFYFWVPQLSSILVTSYQDSQNLKLTQHDAKKHNPQSVQHGTQFIFCPRVLTATAWKPDKVTDRCTVSDRWQANWQTQCSIT